MAKSLRLKVTAEGVETEAQMSFLQEHGCDEIQGFYFSKAVPADEAASMLSEGGRRRAGTIPNNTSPFPKEAFEFERVRAVHPSEAKFPIVKAPSSDEMGDDFRPKRMAG